MVRVSQAVIRGSPGRGIHHREFAKPAAGRKSAGQRTRPQDRGARQAGRPAEIRLPDAWHLCRADRLEAGELITSKGFCVTARRLEARASRERDGGAAGRRVKSAWRNAQHRSSRICWLCGCWLTHWSLKFPSTNPMAGDVPRFLAVVTNIHRPERRRHPIRRRPGLQRFPGCCGRADLTAAHARVRRPMRCTKYAFGGSGATLNPWSQALQKMFRLIPTRGLRSKQGVAIRALPGVDRDHNAHTVRMILRNIFDHSGNIIQIAKPQRKIDQASQSQTSTSARPMPAIMAVVNGS
jgi:hypothetical protein